MRTGVFRNRVTAAGYLVLVVIFGVSGQPVLAQAPSAVQRPADDAQGPPRLFDEVVVTATAQAEPIVQTGMTMTVLDSSTIAASTATTVAGLLAEHGIAYVDQWSASQAQLNIRGATTDGQGRDFRSQIVVLINGRRAGTSNIAKLSLREVERVEIVRGPGSLLYGSQAIGGVINLITRTGAQGASRSLALNGGSWGAVDGSGHLAGSSGKLDFAVAGHAGRRGDYDSGSDSVEEPLANTSYSQGGGLVSLGYARSSTEHLTVTGRMDGIFNSGFRGSQYDLSNDDTRYNQSIEAVYTRGSQGPAKFTGQYYFFRDVDDFHWGSRVIQNDDGTPGPGFAHDNNFRVNSGHGVKAIGTFNWAPGATLLTGADAEFSRLRSERERVALPGGPGSQAPPFDNNANTWTTGIYAEQVQKLKQERLTLRGGLRFDYGQHAIKTTPNRPLLAESSADYTSLTYRAGVVGRVHQSVTLRAGVGTGYRAPTPTELTANFITIGGGQIIGNPDLDPEETINGDVGAAIQKGPLSVDLDLFRSRIRNRISTAPIAGNRSQFVNRATSDIAGLELQSRAELGDLRLPAVRFWVALNGVYNFIMRDNDAEARGLATDRIDRTNQYLGSLQIGVRHRGGWTAQLSGALEGPLWYDTEEYLLIPAAEPFDAFIHRKDPYWLWSATTTYPLRPHVRLRASVTNLTNANVHPTFIALNSLPALADPRFSNGGFGNSLPGRGFLIGVEIGR